MGNKLIDRIVSELKELGSQIILMEDPQGFFQKKEVQSTLKDFGFYIVDDTGLSQRTAFELRFDNPERKFLFLAKEPSSCLEDIRQSSARFRFLLSDYLFGYHTDSVLSSPLQVIDKLFEDQPITAISKSETLRKIAEVLPDKSSFDLKEFTVSVKAEIAKDDIDWFKIIQLVSYAVRNSVGSEFEGQVITMVDDINKQFQGELNANYDKLLNSNPLGRPKVVSKIMDYIHGHRNDKDALIVLDGFAYWQYFLLKEQFSAYGLLPNESYTYSWVPSITQLSRQAIFRGQTPVADYIQGPTNEERLFRDYWRNRDLADHQIAYMYGGELFEEPEAACLKLAWVLKDFDDIMHSSSDYEEVLIRSRLAFNRLKIPERISRLVDAGFNVYLTTDHGSIKTKPWRKLKGNETLTHRSGSKSMRHIEYDSSSKAMDFVNTNQEIVEAVAQKDNMIFFTNQQCFDSKSIITHGGSHLMEVVIPFIKLSK